MAESQNLRYPIVPVEILGIDAQEISGCEGSPWGMKNIQGFMNKLTQLAEALVYRVHIGRLFTGPLQWGAYKLMLDTTLSVHRHPCSFSEGEILPSSVYGTHNEASMSSMIAGLAGKCGKAEH